MRLTSGRQNLLVNAPDTLKSAFVDVEIGQVGQEIVPDEDTHQNEVVDDALEVIRELERGRERRELEVEVLAQQRQVQQEEVCTREAALSASASPFCEPDSPCVLLDLATKGDFLSKETEVGIMTQ